MRTWYHAGMGFRCGLIIPALLLLPLTAGAIGLDLTRAIDHALKQNRNLALAALGPQSAGLAIASAESVFRLSVRPEASLSVADTGGGTGVYGINAARKLRTGTEISARVVSEEFDGTSERQERAIVEVTQPLFRFSGRLINEEPVTQARSALLRARRQLESQRQDLILEVVRGYEDILRLEQQLKADLKSLQRTDTLYRSTKAKEAIGRGTRVDTLRVELQQGQSLSRVEANRERLESTRRAFSELLGFSPDTTFELAPTRLLDIKLPEPVQAARIAFENRLEYAQALEDYRDSARGVSIARKGLWPDLRLVARFERIREPVSTTTDENRWFVGLSADTDFNLARERATLGQAQLNEQSASRFIQVLELSIARELQQAILAYRRNNAELGISERNLKHASARLQLARRLFELGRGDNFSVTDAEEAFVQAESLWLSARSSASISGYQLLRTMGTLTELPADLKPKLL